MGKGQKSFLKEVSGNKEGKFFRYSNDDSRRNDTPNNKIIVRGLASHLTEADVSF